MPRADLRQRLFARFGSIPIMVVVLATVIGWIGALGWALLTRLDWYQV